MLAIEVSKIPPEGLEIDKVLSGPDVHLDGEEGFSLLPGARLRSRVDKGDDETVHVQGHLAAELGLTCGRCLESFGHRIDEQLDLFFLPHGAHRDVEEEDEVQLTDRDLVVAYYQGDRIDLGYVLREQFFLSLPMKRLCREGCQGLCPSCGINRNENACDCPPPSDARLTLLKDILGRGRP